MAGSRQGLPCNVCNSSQAKLWLQFAPPHAHVAYLDQEGGRRAVAACKHSAVCKFALVVHTNTVACAKEPKCWWRCASGGAVNTRSGVQEWQRCRDPPASAGMPKPVAMSHHLMPLGAACGSHSNSSARAACPCTSQGHTSTAAVPSSTARRRTVGSCRSQ